jgi:hypothetical protein
MSACDREPRGRAASWAMKVRTTLLFFAAIDLGLLLGQMIASR